jgi:hypothetical protein
MFPVLAQYDLLVFFLALAGWLLYPATVRAPGRAAGLTPAAHSAAELAGFWRFSPDSSAFPFANEGRCAAENPVQEHFDCRIAGIILRVYSFVCEVASHVGTDSVILAVFNTR